MKCPVCGAAELIHDTRDLPSTYKGETTTIPAVASMRSHGTKTANLSRRWLWSSCSSCWIATPTF